MSHRSLQARALLQRAVLRTNDVRGLRRVNAVPYAIALRLLGRLCERTDGVRGAFVRSGMARHGWTPGLSDVDLLVVLDDGRSPSDERRAATGLTRSYGRLKRGLPMLGELEIVAARDLDARTAHGVDAGAVASWPRLGDPPAPHPAGPAASASGLAALRAYRYHLLPWCWAEREDDPRAPFIRGRATVKLERSLGRPTSTGPDGRPPADLILAALEALRETLGPPASAVGRQARSYGDAVAAGTTAAQRGDTETGLREPSLLALDGVIATAGAPACVYAILRDDVDGGRRRQCVEDVLARFDRPVIVDRRVLAHLLLTVDPLEHFGLLQARVVLHGRDPLPLACGLDEATLRRSVLDYAVDMLGYPYAEDWQALDRRAFCNVLLGWFVRTAAYLADGTMETTFERQRAYYRARFPALAEIVDPDAGTDDPELRFAVLRALVDEIRDGMVGQADAAASTASAGSSPSWLTISSRPIETSHDG